MTEATVSSVARRWGLTSDPLIQSPSEENGESQHPFFDADQAVAVFVKRPEDWETDEQEWISERWASEETLFWEP